MGKKKSTSNELTDSMFIPEDAPPVPEPILPDVPTSKEVAAEEAKLAIPEKPKVKLSVFLAACGLRWDQMAGFKRWALTKKLPRMTMSEWREKHQEYLTAPM